MQVLAWVSLLLFAHSVSSLRLKAREKWTLEQVFVFQRVIFWIHFKINFKKQKTLGFAFLSVYHSLTVHSHKPSLIHLIQLQLVCVESLVCLGKYECIIEICGPKKWTPPTNLGLCLKWTSAQYKCRCECWASQRPLQRQDVDYNAGHSG